MSRTDEAIGAAATPRDAVGARRARAVYAVVAAAALVTRLVPLLSPGSLTAVHENDDGVMYTASLALWSGQVPYRDFVFMHPPGVLLGLLPFAAVGRLGDDAVGLGVARLVVVALGVLNAVLVARLLRSRGLAAMAAGGLLYALWGAAVLAERTVLLEPALTTGLLVALLCVTGVRRAVLWSGVVLGIACAVKYWAVVDVLLVGGLIASRHGWRAAGRFVGGVAAGAGVVILPFFVSAPGAMWRETVLDQLGRPEAAVSIGVRGRSFSLLGGFQGPDAAVPGALWLVLTGICVLAVLWPTVRSVARRIPVRDVPDDGWWALIAAVHLVVLGAAASFYYHYAAWAAAPVALVVGSLAGRVVARARRKGPARFARLVGPVLAAGAVGLAGVLLVGDLRHMDGPEPPRAQAVAWAAGRGCVWGRASDLVWAGVAGRDMANRCDVFVDDFGVGLTLDPPRAISSDSDITAGNPRWRAAVWSQLQSADGVMFPADEGRWRLDPAQSREFRREFTMVARVGDLGLWDRAPAA